MELPYTRGFDFLFILDGTVDLEYVYDSSFDLIELLYLFYLCEPECCT